MICHYNSIRRLVNQEEGCINYDKSYSFILKNLNSSS